MKILQIQGLRGIAVLAVMLFHSQIGPFGLGYLGVDIFFVISGFVVTWSVFPSIAQGTFSAPEFFMRRVARLFPVLFVVTCAALLASYVLQAIFEFRENLVDAIAALFYVANFRFFLSLDYFAIEALHRPFTHYWSLGVEEQFYLTFPLLVLLFTRARVIGALFLLSLVAYLGLSFFSTSAGFYLPFGRAFQFLAGVMLAVAARKDALPPYLPIIATCAVGGALSIALDAYFFTDIDPWPFVATAATVLAITLRPRLHFLSFRPLCWVGDVSYSLYLVHWPIVVFLYRLGVPTDSARGFVLYGAASIVGAALLHYAVELPILRYYREGKLPRLPLVGASILAALAPIAVFIWLQAGTLSGNNEDIRDWALNLQAKMADTWKYSNAASGPFANDGRPKVLVIGDSTAKDFYNSLFLDHVNLDLRYRAVSHQCGISFTSPLEVSEQKKCERAIKAITDDVAAQRPDTVVLATYWQLFEFRDVFDVAKALAKTSHIVIVGPPVFYGAPVSQLAYNQVLNGGAVNISAVNKSLSIATMHDSEKIGATARSLGFDYIDRWQVLCGGLNCPVLTQDGKLIQADKFHLTLNGAEFFGRRMAQAGTLRLLGASSL